MTLGCESESTFADGGEENGMNLRLVITGWGVWFLSTGMLPANPGIADIEAAGARRRPFLCPPVEKQRLLERIRSI